MADEKRARVCVCVKVCGTQRNERKGESKAKGKAKAKAKPSSMSLEEFEATFTGTMTKQGDWIKVEKARGPRDACAGQIYFEFVDPQGGRYRSKAAAVKAGYKDVA